MTQRFTAKVLESIPTKPGCWNYLRVGVFDGDVRIGEYQRNYSALYDTFFPFKQGEQWLALYSKDYTSTRLMSLPDCRDIGGEQSNEFGFCPVEYYVPTIEDSEEFHPYGFVAGCVWGDDSSWKIQYLDLSRAAKGILARDDRFGYIELPREMSLAQAIHPIEESDYVEITVSQTFNLTEKKGESK